MKEIPILVIDDDPDIRDLISQVLGDEGYAVQALSDGTEAVEIVREHQPALILLDLMMPRITGWDVARMLRAEPSTAHVPIILVSASRDLDDARSGLMVNGSISKPFDIDLLIDMVRSFVSPVTE